MVQKRRANPFDPYGERAIARAIQDSSIPYAYQLAYLTLIVQGRFSLQTLEDAVKKMDEVSLDLKVKKKALQEKIAELKAKRTKVDCELDHLAVEFAESMKHDADFFLQYVSNQKEADHEKKNLLAIAKLTQKLEKP